MVSPMNKVCAYKQKKREKRRLCIISAKEKKYWTKK
jgi:hypothetical protein